MVRSHAGTHISLSDTIVCFLYRRAAARHISSDFFFVVVGASPALKDPMLLDVARKQYKKQSD